MGDRIFWIPLKNNYNNKNSFLFVRVDLSKFYTLRSHILLTDELTSLTMFSINQRAVFAKKEESLNRHSVMNLNTEKNLALSQRWHRFAGKKLSHLGHQQQCRKIWMIHWGARKRAARGDQRILECFVKVYLADGRTNGRRGAAGKCRWGENFHHSLIIACRGFVWPLEKKLSTTFFTSSFSVNEFSAMSKSLPGMQPGDGTRARKNHRSAAINQS